MLFTITALSVILKKDRKMVQSAKNTPKGVYSLSLEQHYSGSFPTIYQRSPQEQLPFKNLWYLFTSLTMISLSNTLLIYLKAS